MCMGAATGVAGVLGTLGTRNAPGLGARRAAGLADRKLLVAPGALLAQARVVDSGLCGSGPCDDVVTVPAVAMGIAGPAGEAEMGDGCETGCGAGNTRPTGVTGRTIDVLVGRSVGAPPAT
mmetsp:Transcript_85491/g.161097  ORF Transcript_85491/g.161097 Transcript_85491/m.161097 type:complete len:121 (+) Transcript_85491:362-724(+)